MKKKYIEIKENLSEEEKEKIRNKKVVNSIRETLKSWPQWKRDYYNECIAVAEGSIHY